LDRKRREGGGGEKGRKIVDSALSSRSLHSSSGAKDRNLDPCWYLIDVLKDGAGEKKARLQGGRETSVEWRRMTVQ